MTPNMFDVIHDICCVCKKTRPSFGLKEGKPTHCATCMTIDMSNIVSKMCFCGKVIPTFGLEEGKATHCTKCKTSNMFDVKCRKRCVCGKISIFGLELKNPTHCAECKTPEMFDVINKKCFCGKAQPTFGLEKGKYTHCKECKTLEMFDVHSKMCFCKKKRAHFGLKIGNPTHCSQCKSFEMFDVTHKKCITEKCDTQTYNKAYNGYCARCFGNLFPDSPIVRNFKTKERLVVDFIREQYPDFTWKFDTIIDNACSKRRPDIFLDLGFQVIIIEVDENQHQGYENICENKRLMELSQDIAHRPMVFIRFNPHLASKTRCFATYFLFYYKASKARAPEAPCES
jgi:hypothetical protein